MLGTVVTNIPLYKEYVKWVNEAPSNSRFIYHKGNSLGDSTISYAIGREVKYDAIKGKVLLFQRATKRVDYKNREFEYIAVRINHPPKALIPNSLPQMELA